MSENATVKVVPRRLNITVYEPDPWRLLIGFGASLPSLVGATIVAKARLRIDGTTVDLTVTPVDLAARKFYLSHPVGIHATWDLQITLPGSEPRTYLQGLIKTVQDAA